MAEVGPTYGPTRRRSHLGVGPSAPGVQRQRHARQKLAERRLLPGPETTVLDGQAPYVLTQKRHTSPVYCGQR
jgi:hypothetical protein